MNQPPPFGPQSPHPPQQPLSQPGVAGPGMPPGQDDPPPGYAGQGFNPYTAPQAHGAPAPPVQSWSSTQAEVFAPCPRCGCTYAEPVKFSWWGGMLGPKLFTHVKCCNCTACYNGKRGTWNTANITAYMVVSLVFTGIVIALLFSSGWLR